MTPPNVIQVAVLKYPIDTEQRVIVCDPPLTGIITLPNTDATILFFTDLNVEGIGFPEMAFVNEIISENEGVLLIQRGSNGSWTYKHAAGVKILSGPPPNFVEFDPSGPCDVSPWDQIVNSGNGNLWYCPTSTQVWTRQSY